MRRKPTKAETAPAMIKYPKAWPWILFGFAVVLALPGGLLAWGAVAEISGAVIGQGTVTVESHAKAIQHLDGGIVSEISVKNGDRVSQGDVLLRLDPTSPRSSLAISTARLNELYAQKARLESEHSGGADVEFPQALTAAEADERVASLMKSQRALFVARRTRLGGEKSLLEQQIEQLGELVKGLSSDPSFKVRQAELIDQEIASVRPLLEQGLYTQSRFLALQREAARLSGEVGKLVGEIARARGSVTETRIKIGQIDKDFVQSVLTELREAQGKVTELEEQRVAIMDRLQRVEIRAPRSGYVHNLAVHTLGGVVSPASTIMEIIPDNDEMIVEARVAPQDVDQIELRQEATIRFAAFDQKATPTVTGHVKKISAAQLADRLTGASYFSVIIEIEKSQFERLGMQLVPGMPAEVFIRTVARSALSYFAKPLSDALARAFRER